SSGSRINKAGDDAAGLAVSEKLKSQIRSMRQAIRNTNDGVSLIQVAEGSFNEISNILVRLRELSIEGASDTIGDTERGFLNKEVQQLKSEITRIAQVTEYDGTKLLNGTAPALEVQVGIYNKPTEDRFIFDTEALHTDTEKLGLSDVSTATKENAQNNLEMIDKAIVHVNDNRATLGALQNRMQSTINNSTLYNENISAANSRIRDTDIATESSEMVKNNILTQQTVAVLAQANQLPQLALKLLG
ncbi:MAG: flagellin N-terminal helical domain-containing protein, partial [Bdellovibrionota bacterium]